MGGDEREATDKERENGCEGGHGSIEIGQAPSSVCLRTIAGPISSGVAVAKPTVYNQI